MRIASLAPVVVAVALVAGGCARQPVPHSSLKDAPAPKVTPAEAPDKNLRDWCASRHLDRQQGKPPGGAESPEQVEEGNRVCGALYRYPGYLEP